MSQDQNVGTRQGASGLRAGKKNLMISGKLSWEIGPPSRERAGGMGPWGGGKPGRAGSRFADRLLINNTGSVIRTWPKKRSQLPQRGHEAVGKKTGAWGPDSKKDRAKTKKDFQIVGRAFAWGPQRISAKELPGLIWPGVGFLGL